MNINKKNDIYIILLSIFVFSRYLITLFDVFPDLIDSFKKIYFFVSLILIYISTISLCRVERIYRVCLFYILFLLSYYTFNSDLTSFLTFIIILYAIQYNVPFYKIILITGTIYLFILLYAIVFHITFEVFLFKSIFGRNYIGSVLLCLYCVSLYFNNFYSKFLSIICFVILVLIQFRTGILAALLLMILINYKSFKFLIFLISIFLTLYFTIGFDFLINKWDNSSDISSGRFEIWIAYLKSMINNLPLSLLPLKLQNIFITKVTNPTIGFDRLMETHNLYLDLIYKSGIIIGCLIILILFLPYFYGNKNKVELYTYYSLLLFAFFEPTITFSSNLISIYFTYLFLKLTISKKSYATNYSCYYQFE